MKSLEELKEIYDIDLKANSSSVLEYLESKKYYHGHQLSEDTLAILNSRGQPPIIENIFKMIVNKILGYKAQNIQELKVLGRQEEDKVLADLLNDLLKIFSESEEYEKEILKRDKDLIFGMAVCELWIEQDEDKDYHLSIKNIPSDCFLIDRYSVEKDAKDARRFHKTTNLSKKVAKKLFGNKALITNHQNYDDRVFVIETYILENHNGKEVFSRYCWHEEGGIYLYEKMPFKNGCHPFIIQKFNIDEKLKWYGLFRDIKPLQDYINFAENRMANMMGSLKAFYEEDAVINVNEFIESASLDNSFTKVRSNALKEKKIEFVQHHADIQALSQKANEKRNLAKILSGLNDEALGMAINRQSGIAIAQRRDAGLMGMQDFLKASDLMDKNIFKKALDYITHYFTKEQVFKIVDEKIGERYFKINTNENNKIKIGKFDLIFKTQLKTQGREERFAHWSEMLKTLAGIRPDLVADILPLMLKDTDSPIVADLEELLAIKEENNQKAMEANAPLMQMQQELSIEQLKASILETKAKAMKYQAQGNLALNLANEEEPTQTKKGQDLR
ncbi:portal protein [Campylobacter sp. LR264d]|uniref:portal protein n=1 Tax=Campylobacter sp. LR264d TaxID=2593544 RepID=UPI00123A0C4B|nr:portal protein [Campylobacter sp. LR264d]KAA6234359.1 portal protein [Campylobacter sp. LR264d]